MRGLYCLVAASCHSLALNHPHDALHSSSSSPPAFALRAQLGHDYNGKYYTDCKATTPSVVSKLTAESGVDNAMRYQKELFNLINGWASGERPPPPTLVLASQSWSTYVLRPILAASTVLIVLACCMYIRKKCMARRGREDDHKPVPTAEE